MTEINEERFEASRFQRKMERRCIYKCPYGLVTIKNLKGKHIPHMVSLGPYHHGEEQLRAMEFHKSRALHDMIVEAHIALPSPSEPQEYIKNAFMESLKKVEDELRDCYDQLDPKWSSHEDFLEMMLHDGCFILKVLRCSGASGNSNSGSDGTTSDPIFGSNVSPYIRAVLRRDMLLLENQIPLLVLERLLDVLHQRGSSYSDTYLNQLISNFFGFKLQLGCRRSLHVLDVYRECLIRSPRQVPNQDPNPSTRKSCDATCCHCFLSCLGCQVVTQADCRNPQGQDSRGLSSRTSTDVQCIRKLGFAGVTFKRSQGGWLSDIDFNERNGVLSLPFLEIDDNTAAKFMNLIAFEQVHPTAGRQVTSYFVFMDALLDTGEDVSVLISNGIVRNELGSDDAAAKLFNSLGDGVVDVQNDGVADLDEVESVRGRITKVRKKLNVYASSNWNTWIADLKHKYFDSPWACMSLFAAILLISLAILQTAYTVSDYYKG